MIPTILAVVVVVIAVPLNWLVTLRLWRLHRQDPDLQVLRERALVAVHMALIITIFAGVFLNNGMETPLLNLEQTQLLTRTAILSLVIPAFRWLWLYRNGNHRE